MESQLGFVVGVLLGNCTHISVSVPHWEPDYGLGDYDVCHFCPVCQRVGDKNAKSHHINTLAHD